MERQNKGTEASDLAGRRGFGNMVGVERARRSKVTMEP